MELYLNNIKVDLNDRLPFPLTFNISDIKDLTARKGNNSKTIKLPGTQVNCALMTQVFSWSASEVDSGISSTFINFDPAVRIPARYYHNSLLEFQGVAQLSECRYSQGTWEFDILLISETIDYIGRLAKVKLSELDMSEYNHLYTRTNQVSTWNGNIELNGVTTPNVVAGNYTGLGYYYGMIDYGYQRVVANQFEVDQLPPQIFVYDILKHAFEYCGLSWSSTFLESQRFKRLLLAFEGGVLPQIDSTTSAAQSATMTEDNDGTGNLIYYFQSIINGLWQEAYQYDPVDVTILTDPANQVQQTNAMRFVASSEGTFTVDYYGDHTLDIDPTFANFGTTNYALELHVFVDNSLVSNDTIYQGTVLNYSTLQNLSINFTYSRDFYLLINQELRCEIMARFNTNSDTPGALEIVEYTLASAGSNIDVIKKIQNLTAGTNVNISTFLPQMDAGAFFKGLVTMFNLYVKPNVDNPTVMEIEPLNDFYNSSADAIDWTAKVDYSKDMSVIPTINYASKNYVFRWESDEDYFNTKYRTDIGKDYGNFQISSTNQFAQGDTEYTVPFSQKLLAQIPFDDVTFTDLIVPRTFQIQQNEDASSEMQLIKGKPFIVQLGGLRTGAWVHVDESGVSYNETDYPYVGHLDSLDTPTFDLNWGVPDFVYWITAQYPTDNLYFYHEKFIKELLSRYGKEVQLSAMLDSNDINTLDFRNLINIDGVVFRLQAIKDYDSGKDESTKLELIRIIEGEGISGRVIEIIYDAIGTVNWRQTEDGQLRQVEDGEFRRIE
jgi:hypothetical protein